MLSLNKRNYANKKTIDKLNCLWEQGIIYFQLVNYYCNKLDKRKIDKRHYIELNKLKKHCSYKKLKHYISIDNNSSKKIRKKLNTIKVKCKSCGCDMPYHFFIKDCDNCCIKHAKMLGIL